MSPLPAAAALGCCHRFAVEAEGRPLGVVETPVFAGTALEPVALVVRPDDSLPGTFRIVPASLVVDVDAARQKVTLVAGEDAILALHEFELRDLAEISRRRIGACAT